jgi:ankyrin repeat protein
LDSRTTCILYPCFVAVNTSVFVAGNTALHDCAESGCLGIMKLLLSYQARMEQDAYGMTPLLAAAVTGHAKIVEYICSRHDCNTVQMIDALELLGATYVDKKRDMLGAVDLWKRAMAQRLNYQVWKRGGGQPKAAYCYAVEARTMDEVEDLLTDQDDMRMQALLIRERVLGPTHPDTSYYIRYRGAVYADTGEFERCTVLWMYALDMQQRSFDPLSQMTQSSFLSFAELFSFMLGDKLEDELPQDVDYSQILVVFEKALTEARRGKIAMQEAKDSKLSFNRLVLILMHFLKLLCDIEEHMSKDDRYKFRKMTYQLVKMELQGEKGFRLLHFACAAATSNVGKHPVCQYPSLQVVKLLLHVGETVDCRDADGNTPLHIASMEQPCDPQIIDLLIDSGAHIDTVNAQGQRPLDLFPPETVCGLQSPVNAMSLQCLAAAVIRKHHIPYDMVLSKKLVEFVDAH